ncbi:MAG: hypothetical protein EA401_14225 [Planctomycetota bacterium]|nr:MAG: hypothetical protein EA401_14225 [Planctomycetota bacterium]
MEILAILMLILGPILVAIVFAFVQLFVYKVLTWIKVLNAERIPMFPILLFRGLIILLALITLGAISSMYFKDGPDPMTPGAAP